MNRRKQTVRLSMCSRKFPYRNRSEAETFIDQIVLAGRDRQPNKTLHAYKCPFCIFWHLGHTKGK